MAGETHRFSVGKINCTAVLDGSRVLKTAEEVHGFYPDAPLEELRAVWDSQSEAEHDWCFTPLLIETAGQHVLADTGNGSQSGQPGGLALGLQAEDVAPEAVDLIFITHAHGDHINGMVNPDGSPAFPNARYAIGRVEWDFWHSEAALTGRTPEYVTAVRDKLAVMKQDLTLVDPGDSIAPGVTAVEAYGHTPGHMALMVESEGERLLHIVDIVHMLIQVTRPDWSPRFDVQPEITPATRRRLMQQAVDENLLTFSFHLPFPGLARFEASGDGYIWKPEA